MVVGYQNLIARYIVKEANLTVNQISSDSLNAIFRRATILFSPVIIESRVHSSQHLFVGR